jgi:transcription elongation factor Elf1
MRDIHLQWLLFKDKVQQIFSKYTCSYCSESKDIIVDRRNGKTTVICGCCLKVTDGKKRKMFI